MHKPATELPQRQIRALYDADTIRVYQAYSDSIADAALAHEIHRLIEDGDLEKAYSRLPQEREYPAVG